RPRLQPVGRRIAGRAQSPCRPIRLNRHGPMTTRRSYERTSMSKLVRLLVLALVAVLAIAAAGCGSGGSKSKGGTVTVLDVGGGIDSLDPGYWYYETDYTEIGQPTQMWLYGWKPNDTTPSPEIATGMPVVTNGGKTITIKIKPGIKY